MEGYRSLSSTMSYSVVLPSSFLRKSAKPGKKSTLKNSKLTKTMKGKGQPRKKALAIDLKSTPSKLESSLVKFTSQMRPSSSTPKLNKPSVLERRKTSISVRKKPIHPYHQNYLEKAYSALRSIGPLPPASPSEIKRKSVVLPPTTKKTVIFDLDETLVHTLSLIHI